MGGAFGAIAGFMVLVFGAPALALAVVTLLLAFAVARSLALLSGAFVGVGGTWLALSVRAQLACDAFDAAPNQGCQGFNVEPFLFVSTGVLLVGLAAGAIAWRTSLNR